MKFPDLQGRERRESTATGMTLYEFGSNVRVKRLRPIGEPSSEFLVLEWFDGSRWLHIMDTNEMSDDYAFTKMRSYGSALQEEDTRRRGNR